MGLISKIFMIIIIMFAAYWAYGNINVSTVNICISQEKQQTSITCVTSRDCANFLTSLYGDYEDTSMNRFILSQTTTCNIGQCEINHFERKKQCSPGERSIKYKATLKDILTK